MTRGNLWHKMPDTGLPLTPQKNYERFLELATKRFIKDFKHNFPAYITPKQQNVKWLITKERLWLLKNIFIKAVEDSIALEDFKLQTEGYEKTIEKLNKLISGAKKDLDYIEEKASEKAEEEIKHG